MGLTGIHRKKKKNVSSSDHWKKFVVVLMQQASLTRIDSQVGNLNLNRKFCVSELPNTEIQVDVRGYRI